mmetsp:Transcript_6350/g.16919  ORF Transcript_6350/g.16919 Transcript_6350/m.16919 type:complete len:330 (-) Transcript_6350:256-1245(-)
MTSNATSSHRANLLVPTAPHIWCSAVAIGRMRSAGMSPEAASSNASSSCEPALASKRVASCTSPSDIGPEPKGMEVRKPRLEGGGVVANATPPPLPPPLLPLLLPAMAPCSCPCPPTLAFPPCAEDSNAEATAVAEAQLLGAGWLEAAGLPPKGAQHSSVTHFSHSRHCSMSQQRAEACVIVSSVSRVLGMASTSGMYSNAAQHKRSSGVSSSASMEFSARSVPAMSVRLVTASRCWSMPTGGGGVEDGEGGSTSRGSGPEPPTKEKGWRVPLRLRGAAGGVLHTPSQLPVVARIGLEREGWGVGGGGAGSCDVGALNTSKHVVNSAMA